MNRMLQRSKFLSNSLLCTLWRYNGKKKKLKWSRYRPGVAQRVGTGIAIPFHDHGTRRGCVVSSTPRPNFTPGKDQVPILQEAGCAPGLVWTGRKSRPHRDLILDHPARGQSLYRLGYPAHRYNGKDSINWVWFGSFWNIRLAYRIGLHYSWWTTHTTFLTN